MIVTLLASEEGYQDGVQFELDVWIIPDLKKAWEGNEQTVMLFWGLAKK